MNKAILELTLSLWKAFLIIFAAFFLVTLKNLFACFIVAMVYVIFDWLAEHPELLMMQIGRKKEAAQDKDKKPEQNEKEKKLKLW